MTHTFITAVSYYNTIPFIYGIEQSGFLKNYNLSLDVPSMCATKLLSGKADIGLIPIGSLVDFDRYHVISDLCIGAENEVKSVLLLSNSPITEISKIYLDSDSRTSVNLARILTSRYWNISPYFIGNEGFNSLDLQNNEGIVLIGDKTFGQTEKFNFCYDLATEWIKFTGKPFVFAAWISRNPLSPEFVSDFNRALNWGVEHIDESILNSKHPNISFEELQAYLSQNISYRLTKEKLEGMELFLQYQKQL